MKYEYWLAAIPCLSDYKKRLLREEYKEGRAVYYIEEMQLRFLPFLEDRDVEAILKAKKEICIEKEWEYLEKQNIRFIPCFSEAYPKKLWQIPDPPYALYVKGNLPKEEIPGVAIVGARKCTPYGQEMALDYGKYLAEHGVQIISGMARGIDGAGQRGALDGGGMTFGVLGCGVDICYPRDHIGLYMDIQRSGGILSESRQASPSHVLSDEEPDHQRTVGFCAGYGGKGEERFSDHGRPGSGAGQRCLCAAWPRDEPVEPGLPPADPAGGGNSDYAERSAGGIGFDPGRVRAKIRQN